MYLQKSAIRGEISHRVQKINFSGVQFENIKFSFCTACKKWLSGARSILKKFFFGNGNGFFLSSPILGGNIGPSKTRLLYVNPQESSKQSQELNSNFRRKKNKTRSIINVTEYNTMIMLKSSSPSIPSHSIPSNFAKYTSSPTFSPDNHIPCIFRNPPSGGRYHTACKKSISRAFNSKI